MAVNKHRIKILVACHRADPNIRQSDIYMPIQVGKALHPELDLGFQTDDTGDNISHKNASYCELTALYWAWKNLKDIDYIGLCHYRRYFKSTNYSIRRVNIVNSLDEISILDTDLINHMHEKDIIVAKPNIYPFNLATQYAIDHRSEDVKILSQIINNKYNDYYPFFRDIMIRNNHLSPYNMFIMPWDTFDRYCVWIFNLLADLEQEINISNYSPYQARVFGFIGERLLNIFLEKEKKEQKINLKYRPICFIDFNKKTNLLKEAINNLRYNLAYKIGQCPDQVW